ADRIDPRSTDVAEAFRKRGYRKVNDRWIAPNASRPKPRAAAAEDEEAEDGRGNVDHIGATRAQLLAALGRPERKARVATQGQIVEQWIYRGSKETHFYNFVR